MREQTKSNIRLLSVAAIIAALFYASWPLGYLLNPVGSRGLASNLEAAHQPYNWLFVAMDILCGALICMVSAALLARFRGGASTLIKLAAAGFGIFGILTVVGALLPIDCVPGGAVQCRPMLSDSSFLLHALVSIGSYVGMTLTVLSLWRLSRGALVPRLRWLMHGALAVWFIIGLLTAVLVALSRNSEQAERVFIGLCSLWTVAVPIFSQRFAFQASDSPSDLSSV